MIILIRYAACTLHIDTVNSYHRCTKLYEHQAYFVFIIILIDNSSFPNRYSCAKWTAVQNEQLCSCEKWTALQLWKMDSFAAVKNSSFAAVKNGQLCKMEATQSQESTHGQINFQRSNRTILQHIPILH